jgi:formylglycine-generating enzyme required for sulfatase activity
MIVTLDTAFNDKFSLTVENDTDMLPSQAQRHYLHAKIISISGGTTMPDTCIDRKAMRKTKFCYLLPLLFLFFMISLSAVPSGVAATGQGNVSHEDALVGPNVFSQRDVGPHPIHSEAALAGAKRIGLPAVLYILLADSSLSGTITSGGAGLSGVTVSLTGASSATATTDASGNYSFSNLANGAYTVTPSRTGYLFTPASKSVTISGADVLSCNFTAAATITDPTTGMVLVKVAGGTYTMGDTFGDGDGNERPTHEVTLDDFYIGRYEVTQAQWEAVMGSNPSYFTSCGANCPVEEVSWNDVQTFITNLNQMRGTQYRLPTEAEWEYAARSGGRSERYSGGADVNAVAWYWENSGSTTHPVGGKQANGLGLYDMSGNVWEWVNDWYGSYNGALQTNPTGPSTGSNRVLRGGSWSYDAIYVRASSRDYDYPDSRDYVLGFRLAAPVQ